jgi:hypothetical protein
MNLHFNNLVERCHPLAGCRPDVGKVFAIMRIIRIGDNAVRSLFEGSAILFLCLALPCHGGNAYGTYTVSLDAISEKLPAATWDRGRLTLHSVVKNSNGTFSWGYDGSWPGNTVWGGPTGFASISNDRNWTLYITAESNIMPEYSGFWSGTAGVPSSWTDFENMIAWAVGQLPPQVKAIECENEPTWGSGGRFATVGALSDWIRHIYNGVKMSSRPDLIVLTPSFWTCAPSQRGNFNTLAAYSWNGTNYTYDYCDGLAQHHYNDPGDTNSDGISWGSLATLYPTSYQDKRFTLWYEELEGWYANLRANPYVSSNKPVYFTEFGWYLWVWNGTIGYPDVTQAQQADHLAKAFAALTAEGVAVNLAFDMEGNLNNGRGVTSQDLSLLNTNLSIRPAWNTCNMAIAWLKNVGKGTHSTTLINGYVLHMIDFGIGNVVWTENPTAFAYVAGHRLSTGQDEYGNPITITGGNTVTISESPVFLTYAQPQIASVNLSAGNVVMSGTNGTGNAIYYVLSSTNLALPVNQWYQIGTNQFDDFGAFSATNPITPAITEQYFRLRVP